MIWGVVVGAAVVLAVAGVAKLAKPTITAEAIRGAGFRVDDRAVTALGAAELVVAAAVIVWPVPALASVLGLFYLGFAAFAARLLLAGGAASCGCFGQRSAPIGFEHVLVNLVVVGFACAASVGAEANSVNPVAAIGATCVLFVLLALLPTLRGAGD